MKDKLLLWPLLFEGKLHYTEQGPLAQRMDPPPVTPRGAGWWATREGRGYACDESDQKWIHRLWQEQDY